MATQLKPDDFEFVRTLVRERSAIQLEDKQYLVETRLHSLTRVSGHESIEALVRQLRSGGEADLKHLVVEAMTTNETSFFRDLKPFEALTDVVLPEVIAKGGPEKKIRIWCAACSTGQEPYTIAISWLEKFAAKSGWSLEIHASDLSTGVLDRAKAARFNQLEVNRGLPAPLLVKYFEKRGAEWHLKDEARRLVQFRQVNLIEPLPAMPKFDIVFLRNVLIYFDIETKKRILAKVREQLKPAGFLFLGGAESPLGIDSSFERLAFERSGCYRMTSNNGPAK